MTNVSPKDLLQNLCKDAHPRKQQSLKLIYRLCEEQRKRGSSDFSIAAIGRLSKAAGGPAAGAIRNRTGDDYKALIKAFAHSADRKAGKSSARKSSALNDLLEGVSDPVLRAKVGILFAELESTRGQLIALRHLVGQNAVVYLDQASNSPSAESLAKDIDLSKQERSALERAIAPATLEHWGLIAEPNGLVKTDAGQIVYPVGYLTAIRKVLERYTTE